MCMTIKKGRVIHRLMIDDWNELPIEHFLSIVCRSDKFLMPIINSG
jgi:hypothetical protein